MWDDLIIKSQSGTTYQSNGTVYTLVSYKEQVCYMCIWYLYGIQNPSIFGILDVCMVYKAQVCHLNEVIEKAIR